MMHHCLSCVMSDVVVTMHSIRSAVVAGDKRQPGGIHFIRYFGDNIVVAPLPCLFAFPPSSVFSVQLGTSLHLNHCHKDDGTLRARY